MEMWLVLLACSALVETAMADCSVDGLRYCLSEFLPLASSKGIVISKDRFLTSCKVRPDSLLCLLDFADHCIAPKNEELPASINKTTDFINMACSPASDFMKSLEEYEGCFQNASEAFQSCYNKTFLPVAGEDDDSKWRAECCEYKGLRNCAVQAVENSCGPTASQVLENMIKNVNGVGLEVACAHTFEKCANSKSLVATAVANCSVDGLRCCLSEFLPFVSSKGIVVSRDRLLTSCKVRPDSLLCLQDFADHCIAPTNEELPASINKTTEFINTACSPASDFMKSLEEYEGCFQNASEAFQSCYSKTFLPVASEDDDSKWRAECCEYKGLRNCAVQTVENSCGPTASQVLQNMIKNINGAGLEVACAHTFEECVNSAMTLASSAVLVLISLYTNSFLRFL